MAFRHIVLFKFHPTVSDAQRNELTEAILALGRRVGTVRAMSVGPNTGPHGNYDHAVVVDFDNEAGYMEYAMDPEHQRMARPTMALVAEHAIVQFVVAD